MGEKRQKTAQEQRYQQRVNEKMPRSKTVSQCVRAFIAGGLICCIGQAVRVFGETMLHLDAEGVAALTAIVMVFLGATLTGFGVYDKIGTWAGAGSIVPITGFANSIVSPAMEFNQEGVIFGISAKMFVIAGPIIVLGVSASVVVGLIYMIFL